MFIAVLIKGSVDCERCKLAQIRIMIIFWTVSPCMHSPCRPMKSGGGKLKSCQSTSTHEQSLHNRPAFFGFIGLRKLQKNVGCSSPKFQGDACVPRVLCPKVGGGLELRLLGRIFRSSRYTPQIPVSERCRFVWVSDTVHRYVKLFVRSILTP